MQQQATPSRVLLFDEGSLFRHSGQGVLEAEADLLVVVETGDPWQALEDAARTDADVALVDADLIGSELPSFVARIKATTPGCKILVIIAVEEVGPLVEALEAGASGYLTKSASISDLLEATRSVCRGDVVIPARMLGPLLAAVVGQRAERDESLEKLSSLTPREQEVLLLLGDGYDKDAIAGTLVISPHTARTHVHNILAKLGVHSQLQAAAFARDPAVFRTIRTAQVSTGEDLRTRLGLG
jgi:DNA-binding NarL/FixJ family response regulator